MFKHNGERSAALTLRNLSLAKDPLKIERKKKKPEKYRVFFQRIDNSRPFDEGFKRQVLQEQKTQDSTFPKTFSS